MVLLEKIPAWAYATGILGLFGVLAASLYLMDQVLICECGYVKLWHGVTMSSENSQHLSDWYSFSHIIHGFAFYWFAKILFPRSPILFRLFAAIFVEVSWEIWENTDFIINRYRAVTISLDYYGDSIINSVMDVFLCFVGFVIAWRAPVWLTVFLAVAMEAFVGYMIRDNLALNIIMLLYPAPFILEWQSGL